MRDAIRGWVLAFGALSFLIGTAVGMMLSLDERGAPQSPLAAYGRRLELEYGLQSERAEALAVVLASYEEELESVRARHLPEYHSAMEPELAALGERYGAIIRDRVLPPGARRGFMLASEGLTESGPAGSGTHRADR